MVRGQEKGVGRWMEHAGLMKVGPPRVIDEELEGRVGTQEREEGIVIDQEGFRLWSLRGNNGLSRGESVHGQA